MYAFDYSRPATIADAVKAYAANPEAKLLAGGQTLIPTMKQRLASPSGIVDLGGIRELRAITREANSLTIGAMVTHDTVIRSADVKASIPALAALVGYIGDPAVRNVGTIGGSVANNDPAADYPAALLALGATISTNTRTIHADQFFNGLFTTALEPGEVIVAVSFPVPKRAAYSKLEQRASRYALVGVFVADTATGPRCAVTGCGSNGVFRVPEIEKALAANWSAAALAGIKVAATGIMGDIHGGSEYRAAMVPVIAARAVALA